MKLLNTIRLVISLFPLLIDTIKAVEEAIPGQGKGELKLAMVRTILEASYEAAEDVTDSFAAIWPTLQRTIATVVDSFNKAGIFSKN